MHLEILVLLLFTVATAVAILAHRLRFPYTIALVVAGLVLGQLHVLAPPHLTKELLFTIFLPGLIFEAAFHLEWRHFWRDRLAISVLAIPGVLATTAAVAALLVGGTDLLGIGGIGWASAAAFGALIAATDPIAVVGMLKSLGAPKRLATLMEGESLLNDGTAIVVFGLILAVIAGGGFDPGATTVQFVSVVGLGGITGALIGLAAAHLIQRLDAPMIEITLTTLAAYGAFVIAEEIGASGVIATVVSGLICGNYATHTGMSPTTRVAVETFWEYVAFALNSLVFLLIGFEVQAAALVAAWPWIVLAYVAVVVARVAVVGGIVAALRPTELALPRSWVSLLSWGGLRGAVSMVLVLSLPAAFPSRGLLVTVTFGVVLLLLVVNGLTVGPMLRRLGIGRSAEDRAQYAQARARAQFDRAALLELERMEATHFASPDLLQEVRQIWQARLADNERTMHALHVDREDLRQEEMRRARRHLLLLEKEQALEALRRGTISQETYEAIVPDIDAALFRLDEDIAPSPPEIAQARERGMRV